MPENKQDGRHERRSRGKQVAIETAAQIFVEGGSIPTMAYLAEKSGISERTLFRYFETQDKVIGAVTDYFIPHIASYFTTQPIEGNLEERIRGLVTLRLEYVQRFSGMIKTIESHSTRFTEASEIRKARDILLSNQFVSWLGEDGRNITKETLVLANSLIDLRNLDGFYSEMGTRTVEAVSSAILTLITT